MASPLLQKLRRKYDALSVPIAGYFLFDGHTIHPSYRMTVRERIKLALRMYRNTKHIPSATSYRAHLAMAVKLLEIPPEVEGVVVECGCWQGGSTANLSLVCDIIGRDLIVYDSFEGLPPPTDADKYANERTEGLFRGELETVQAHV